MARPLNTKKLMKQCRAIAAKQQEAAAPKPSQPEPPETIEDIKGVYIHMNPVELEQYLTEFLNTARDAKRRFEEATAAEQYPNSAIQDILHAAEFAPSTLGEKDVVALLNKYRTDRRTAKQELEVTELFQQWAEEHKTAINKLEQALGTIRKVLKRQPNDFYSYKTDAVAPQGSILKPDEPERGEQDGNNSL